jgi:predicted PurR-regulated permease PerM
MDKFDYKQLSGLLLLTALIVLSFLLLKPILMSILFGVVLAFIFSPIYKFFYKITKSKNFSATIICVLLILLIFIPLWFLLPSLVSESFHIYVSSQQADYITPLKKVFPNFFQTEELSNEIGSVIHSFVTRTINSVTNAFSNLILNFPTIFLQAIVVFFVLFFVLRDKDELIEYIQSLLPFSKEIEKKLFESTKGITNSILYGQVVVGLLQGVIAGVAFFLFGVSNSLFLTFLACLAGIFPIIGTAIVWLPVVIYLLIAGNTFAATGITILGLISSHIDNFLRPAIVSKRTTLHSSVVLIGMVGGLFMFGILGVILGPLILAYLLILLELYRNKKGSETNVFIQTETK